MQKNHLIWGMTSHLLSCETACMAKNERDPGSTAGMEIYQIQLKGILDQVWVGSLSDADKTITVEPLENHSCILTAGVKDQAALRGLVTRMWDMNMEIISINKIENKTK